MLRLLIGPAGSGKTAAVLGEIRERVLAQKPGSLLLVPEQYSHEAERELCAACGDTLSRWAEVMSFTGLARRVLQRQGGGAQPLLDKGGRLLCMALALSGVGGQLRVYGAARRSAELPGLLLGAVDEMKTAGVTAEALHAAAAACDGYLSDKLGDAALVLEAYDAVIANGRADPADRLTLLAAKLADSDFGPDSAVYVDGFIDFTQQERAVIRALLKKGVELTVCLTLDELRGENEIFALSRRAAQELAACARELGIESRVERTDGARGRDPALAYFAGQMFSYGAERRSEKTDALRLFRAESPAAECELAAAEALRLVRETGCRWRDIAVAVRGFEDYRPLLESVFRHYGVPLFTARRSDVLSRPLPALIGGAYELIAGGWDVDDLLSYLGTGLTGLSAAECDELGDYVYRWQLRAGAWERRGDWEQHPDGYGAEETEETRERLRRINALRRRVAGPLLELQRRADEAQTAAGQAAALAAYLERVRLPETLERRARELREAGRESMAAEYAQLWELTVNALEQSEAILGDTDMDREGFGRLFARMLAQYDVGIIPVSLDRVSAGDFDRMRRRSIRHLIVLGAADQRLPMSTEPGGIFSEEERRRLLELSIDLGGAGEQELWREFSLIYHVLTLPSDSLTLCCPLTGEEGEPLRPAFVFLRAQKLFDLPAPTASASRMRMAAPGPALTLAAQALHGGGAAEQAAAETVRALWPRRWEALRAASDMTRGRLSPRAVEALYGKELRLSASRIDRFASCKFAYFCQYGLKAKPYEPAGFTPPEIGTFMHFVLETVARAVKERGGFGAVDDAAVRELTAEAVAGYVRTELNDMREKTARFVYLFRRLTRDVESVVLDMAAELRRSDFEPLDFELDFSKASELPPVGLGEDEAALTLTGVADRVDGWLHDGALYLRVVDYKTGRRSFSLSDVWYGMGLQMLLYLFALSEGGRARYGREIRPGGVMYVPARNALLSLPRDPGEEESERMRGEELRRSGLLLDDAAMLEAWEHGEDKKYIPVKFRRGEPAGSVASAEQLGRLAAHIRRTLTGMARQLRRGSIAADPYYRSQQENACLNCDYFDACHFADGENGESCRFQPRLTDGKVWGALEKEAEEGA